MTSSVNTATSAREHWQIQTLQNETYFQHILCSLEGQLVALPPNEDGMESTEKLNLKALKGKWEAHEKVEEDENNLMEKQFQKDLRTVKEGAGEPVQQPQRQGAGQGPGQAALGPGFKIVNELMSGNKLHEGLGHVEFGTWKMEVGAWAEVCNMVSTSCSVQYKAFKNIIKAPFLVKMNILTKSTFQTLMNQAKAL